MTKELLVEREVSSYLDNTKKVSIPKWKDKYRRFHSVKEMKTSYIRNCINAFKEGRIPHNWHGGRKKWEEIFNNELISRQ